MPGCERSTRSVRYRSRGCTSTDRGRNHELAPVLSLRSLHERKLAGYLSHGMTIVRLHTAWV